MDTLYKFEDEEFVWNEKKARDNRRKHGISFEEACEVFFDPFRQSGDASAHFEERQFIIGFSLARKILVVVYVERRDQIRIISARKATNEERRIYEEA
ncbi:MAG: BrnT family toxin [bacterium]